MVTPPKNDAEAAALEAAAAKYRRERAAEQGKARRAEIEPLRAFTESKEFETVLEKAAELAPSFGHIDGVDVHLRPLARFMRNLREALAAYAPPDTEAAPAP